MASLLDRRRGALVDAGPAVDAFGLIDDGNVVNGYGAGRTDVRACSAAYALRLIDGDHIIPQKRANIGPIFKRGEETKKK
jgi:hypothetical protein